MKGLVAWWVKNTVAANLMMVAIILMGIVGFNRLEREVFPTTTINGMTVSVVWLGASPSDVQDQLITRIEDAVSGIDGIDYIEATAREGRGSINVRTKVRADYEKLLDEVKARVDGIQNLPPDSFAPQVFRWDARADYMYMALHGDIDRLTLQRIANVVRQEMAKIPGGELVQDMSKLDEEVTIEISENDLRRYNLTFRQVAAAISGTSVNLSAGEVETSGGNLQMKARNLANTKEEFENIVVPQSSEGGTVYVRDIANVIDGFEDVDFVGSYQGQEAAMFRALTPDIINVSDAGKDFREYIEKKNKELEPQGVKISMWFDGSVMFDARMGLIGGNALMGMILVLIILVLFLRPAVAMWVTVGILVSFAGAIAVMPMLGVSLNMISTFAILLVIGIVVDDAIVVGESIHFHNENGVHGVNGAISGTNMVIKPVFFAVITTIMTFMPWMLLSGPMVTMTSQITLVVIAALVFSLIEAFFILPAHLAHIKPLKPEAERNAFTRFQQSLADGLTNFAKKFFRPFAAAVIKFRYATLSVFIGLMILSFGIIGAGLVKVEMIPNPEGDMIQANIRFPAGTSFERVSSVKHQLDEAVKTVNENSQKDFGVDFELITAPGSIAQGTQVQGFLGLAPAESRTEISSNMIAAKLEEYLGPIPDAYRVQLNADQGVSNNPRGAAFGIASTNPDALALAVKDVTAQLESYGNVVRTFDTLESSAQEMRFTLKPGAERYGVTLADVTRQVREAFFGREVQRLPRNGEDVRVVLRYPEEARDSIDSLEQLRIRGSEGVEVPLYSVAEVTFAPGVSRISRRDRKQVVRSGARIKGGPEAIAEIKKDMNENFFPEWALKHPNAERLVLDDDDLEKTMGYELKLYGAIVFALMYGLLAIAFRSYFQPALILIAIPFAFVGMVFGSMVTGVPMGIMSLFGFFAAAGVAVNDNLVLIDYVNRMRATGVGAYQAVLDACVARFRPILLTSVTTFVGIMPMLAENSVQAQFLKPMVVALAFGVLFDFFLTLILVPAMYGIGIDIKRLVKWAWTGQRQPKLGSSYDSELAIVLGGLEATDITSTGGVTPAPAE